MRSRFAIESDIAALEALAGKNDQTVRCRVIDILHGRSLRVGSPNVTEQFRLAAIAAKREELRMLGVYEFDLEND